MVCISVRKVYGIGAVLLGLLLLSVFILVIPCNLEAAGNIMVVPSITIEDGYDSNIGFTRSDEEDDYYTDIDAGFVLNYDTGLLRLNGNANVALTRFAEEEQRDYERYTLGLNGNYQLFERSNLSFDLSYVDDITLRSELQETGLVYVRSERQQCRAGAGFSHQVSERSILGLNYAFTKTEYEWIGNIDNEQDAITLYYRRTLSNQRDSFTVQPSYSQTSSLASDVDNYGLSFGWTHAFSETSNLNILLGGQYNEITSRLTQPQIVYNPTLDPPFMVIYNEVNRTEETWNFTADFNLQKRGEKYSATIGYNHGLSYTSLGEPTEIDRIYLNGLFTLSERLGVGFAGSLYFNQSESEFYNVDSRYYQLISYISYQLTTNGSFRIEYSYANDKDDTLTGDSEADRHRVFISLNFGFPRRL